MKGWPAISIVVSCFRGLSKRICCTVVSCEDEITCFLCALALHSAPISEVTKASRIALCRAAELKGTLKGTGKASAAACGALMHGLHALARHVDLADPRLSAMLSAVVTTLTAPAGQHARGRHRCALPAAAAGTQL